MQRQRLEDLGPTPSAKIACDRCRIFNAASYLTTRYNFCPWCMDGVISGVAELARKLAIKIDIARDRFLIRYSDVWNKNRGTIERKRL